MQPYKILVSVDILRLTRPAGRDRERVLSFLEKLADNPNTPGDYVERDAVGRPLQIKIVGDYALTYWADHPVNEIKVIHIERADRG